MTKSIPVSVLLLLFLLVLLRITTSFDFDYACGNSDNEECDGVNPCFTVDDGCAFCEDDIECNFGEGFQCLLEENLGFCFDDTGVMECSDECTGCVDRITYRCLCYVFDGDEENAYCPGTGQCQVAFTGYGDVCVEPYGCTENCTRGNSTSSTTTSSSNCFSEKSTCQEQNRGNILVKDLNVGDKVLTATGQFKTVYTIDHKDPSQKATFIQIHYSLINNNNNTPCTKVDNNSNQSSVLELTPSHMVFLHGVKDPVPAYHLEIGDAIQTKTLSQHDAVSIGTITNISHISRYGVWNPITMDGTIVVDGVITSTYSVILGDDYQQNNKDKSFALWLSGVKPSHQDLAHTLMAPYRAFYMMMSLPASLSTMSLIEQRNVYYNGYSAYSSIGKTALEATLGQHVIIQGFVIFSVFVLFRVVTFLLSPLGGAGIGIALISYLYCQNRKIK